MEEFLGGIVLLKLLLKSSIICLTLSSFLLLLTFLMKPLISWSFSFFCNCFIIKYSIFFCFWSFRSDICKSFSLFSNSYLSDTISCSLSWLISSLCFSCLVRLSSNCFASFTCTFRLLLVFSNLECVSNWATILSKSSLSERISRSYFLQDSLFSWSWLGRSSIFLDASTWILKKPIVSSFFSWSSCFSLFYSSSSSSSNAFFFWYFHNCSISIAFLFLALLKSSIEFQILNIITIFQICKQSLHIYPLKSANKKFRSSLKSTSYLPLYNL